MVKVKFPLMSEAASGNFAGIIQFFCGHYAKKAIEKSDVMSENQGPVRSKFKIGAEKWSKELSLETKEEWKSFVSRVYRTKDCIGDEFKLNSYQAWLSFFLTYGEEGWVNYPNPPV
jgi:hypothetical protein